VTAADRSSWALSHYLATEVIAADDAGWHAFWNGS
jgi:hypothetical protein